MPEHRAKGARPEWRFGALAGGRDVSSREVCPICGHGSRCVRSAPVKASPGFDDRGRPLQEREFRAVLCRRVKDEPEAARLARREGRDGGVYEAAGLRGGGRVWAPVPHALPGEPGSGKAMRPPRVTAEQKAQEDAFKEESNEGKRLLAEGWYMRSCGGAWGLTNGVDAPELRAYFAGRGIRPEWFPEGRVPATLRYVPAFPRGFDFEKTWHNRGLKNPLRDRHGKPRSIDDVRVATRKLPDGSTEELASPSMVAAALSLRHGRRIFRGVHQTCLSVARGEDGAIERVTKDGSLFGGGGRRWHASCDGLVIFPGAGATPGNRFPGRIAVVGEGAETAASGQVAIGAAAERLGLPAGACPTAIMVKSAESLKHLAGELESAQGASGLHTIVILVDLDKLRDSDGGVSRTGQIAAVEATRLLREKCPWISVHLRFVRAEAFPELVELVELSAQDLQEMRAHTGGFGCAVETAADGRIMEHRPRGDLATKGGVDWNDVLRIPGSEPEALRARAGEAIVAGIDLRADRAAAEEWMAIEESRLRLVADATPPGISEPVPVPQKSESIAAAGSHRASAVDEPSGGSGGGGSDGGAGGGDGDDDGRPDDDGTPDFWGEPLWGGYTWRHPDDRRKRSIISSRGQDRARLFLLQKCRKPGERRFRLAYWAGQWFWYDGVCWVRVKEEQVGGVVAEWLARFWHRRETRDGEVWTRIDPNERALSEVLAKLAKEVWVDVERMPAWLQDQIAEDGTPLWGQSVQTWMVDREAEDARGDPADYLVDRGGVLRLSWLVEVHQAKRERLERGPFMPSLFTTSALPFVLPLDDLFAACSLTDGPDEREPIWMRHCPTFWNWLVTATCDLAPEVGCQRRRQLGDMLGDSISGRRDLENVYLVPGPKRAGKGVLIKAIMASHGRERVVATTITKMGTQFGLFPLVGAAVAIMGDAHVGKLTDTTQAVENLKAVSGGDPVSVEAKYTDPVTVYLNPRFWIFCNDEPDKLQDNSGALAGRFVVWPLTQSFYGVEDPVIKRNVGKEGRGIAVFALAHYARLFAAAHPRIEMSDVGREVANEFEDSTSVLTGFAKDCLQMDEVNGRMVLMRHDDRSELVAHLHGVYTRWCAQNHKKPVGLNKIVPKLRPLVNGALRVEQPYDPETKRKSSKRWVHGIALRTDLPVELTQQADSVASEMNSPRRGRVVADDEDDDGPGLMP